MSEAARILERRRRPMSPAGALRLSAGRKLRGCLLAVLLLGGCAGPGGGIIQTGPGAEASSETAFIKNQVGDVQAKADLALRKADNRITAETARDIIKTEVSKSREETLTAARDLVRTETKTGLGDWALVLVVGLLRACDCIEAIFGKNGKRNGNHA